MDITLALGGGGSRGHAHIGVLRRLEAEGFRVRAIAGTSAGGLVAAAYAAGISPDEMEEIFIGIDQSKLFGRIAHQGPGLLGLSGAAKILKKILGDRTFHDLEIPCALTSVDINSATEIVLDQGRLLDAVLATIAIPGVFPPMEMGSLRLVDGAVLDPVPVSLARALAPDLPVAAVVLSQTLERPGNFSSLPIPVGVPVPLVEKLTQLRLAQAIGIFIESVDVGERMITALRLQIEAPEVIIRPEVAGIGVLDKVDVHHVVRLGEKAVDAALPRLFRAVSWTSRLRRRLFPPRQARVGALVRHRISSKRPA